MEEAGMTSPREWDDRWSPGNPMSGWPDRYGHTWQGVPEKEKIFQWMTWSAITMTTAPDPRESRSPGLSNEPYWSLIRWLVGDLVLITNWPTTARLTSWKQKQYLGSLEVLHGWQGWIAKKDDITGLIDEGPCGKREGGREGVTGGRCLGRKRKREKKRRIWTWTLLIMPACKKRTGRVLLSIQREEKGRGNSGEGFKTVEVD
jgi:hypothetical protein